MTERTVQEIGGQNDLTATTEQQKGKRTIVLWYHEADSDLLQVLDRCLQLMYRRLGPQVDRSSFGYRKRIPVVPPPYTGTEQYYLNRYEQEKAEYEKAEQHSTQKHDHAVSLLQHAFLFIPCVSNAFMEAFWDDLEQNPELNRLMTNPDFQIMPIVIRPTETGMTYQARPLCTYEGHHLETACKEVAAAMETIVRNWFGPEREHRKTPVDLLFQSGATVQIGIPSQTPTADRLMQRCLDTLTPIQALLEQTSAHAVEAQQRATTSEAELREHLVAVQQQLTTRASERNAGLFARMRQWFTTVHPRKETPYQSEQHNNEAERKLLEGGTFGSFSWNRRCLSARRAVRTSKG